MQPTEPRLRLLLHRWETSRLIIEDSTEKDVPYLHAVFTACSYVEPWDETFHLVPENDLVQLVNQSLATDDRHYRFKLQCIRTKAASEIVGYFHLYHGTPHPHIVWISMFVFHPDYQHQGYGDEVVTGLTEQFYELGYAAIWLEVYLKNWPALRFWIRNGFTSIIKYEGDPIHTSSSHATLELEKQLA